MSFYGKYSGMGGGGGGGVASLDGLTGALTLVAGTGISIVDGVTTITISSTSSGDVTIGPFGSTPNANGLSINGSQVLNMQPADGTHPGGVSITTQTFAGNKTFLGTIAMSSNKITGVASGTVSGDALQFGQINVANGIAPLDGSGKVPYANLPSALMTFKGAWDPTTNTPTLTNGSGLTGDTYRASVGGVSSAPIVDTWFAGDFIIYNGTIWQRSPLADGVISVNGMAGAVILTQGNLTDAGTDGIVITNGTNAVWGSGTSIAQHVADSTHNGYLSSTDWTTFNNKQAAGNYITALTGDVTASGPGSVAATLATVNANVGSFTFATITVNAKGLITAASSGAITNLTDAGTDGITITNGTNAVLGASPVTISQHVADTTHNGYLSSTDWNTFNGKQPAGNYITALTGDVTASGPGSVAATLATVNANVGTFASVTVNGKGLVTAATALSGDATTSGAALTLATVNGNVGSFGSSTSIPSFTVNAKGLITAASGNVVIAPAGTLTGTTLNSTVVTSSLTSVGTITTGVWTGTTIAIANGGTGQTTKAAAFDALSPMTTGGDIIYGGASGTGTRLANGSAGQVLTSNGTTTAPSWTTVTATVITAPPTVSLFNSSSGTYNKNYTFVITSGSATVGATYTNNSVTFTVYKTVASATQVVMSGSGAPSASGTLTKASGTGDATLTFSQVLSPLYLVVEMIAGGGGGNGATSNGSNGNDTTFSDWTAGKGSSGTGGGSSPGGAGGTNTTGTGVLIVNQTGETGSGGVNAVTSIGGNGGAGFWGGAGVGGQFNASGTNAVTNSGSGGGGCGSPTAAAAGPGAGSGGYLKFLVLSPSATYSYGVGAGGAGGTGSPAGGNGAAGRIIIMEYYQ